MGKDKEVKITFDFPEATQGAIENMIMAGSFDYAIATRMGEILEDIIGGRVGGQANRDKVLLYIGDALKERLL